jgi:hypothetical protein
VHCFRTATPVVNRGNWWYSAAFSEFRHLFLNGAQRSVNRKVQGSNPCPGANSEFEVVATSFLEVALCSHFVTIL